MTVNISHMSYGSRETTYANNSNYQRSVILWTRPILEEALKKLYNEKEGLPMCFRMADLGCAFGPNIFLLLSEIIGTIYSLCQKDNAKAPELQIYLDDLPENDFNSVFKFIPSFYKSLNEEIGNEFGSCFIAGVPGSFYERLFPSKSLHFVHSSLSLHWLSQLPEKLDNRGSVYIPKTSCRKVFEAYLNQFRKDFTTFLSLRSEEMVAGGRMILTLLARNDVDFTVSHVCTFWDLFTKALLDMVLEGRIKEQDVDTFNMPFFAPYNDEVKGLVQEEGSFNLEKLETYEWDWDAEDKDDNEDSEYNKHHSGTYFVKMTRAFTEPLLVSHFGHFDLDGLFKRFGEYVANYLSVAKTKPKQTSITISLSRKR